MQSCDRKSFYFPENVAYLNSLRAFKQTKCLTLIKHTSGPAGSVYDDSVLTAAQGRLRRAELNYVFVCLRLLVFQPSRCFKIRKTLPVIHARLSCFL